MTENLPNMQDRLRRVFRDNLGRDFNKTDFRVGEVLPVIAAEGKWPKWNSRVKSISGSTLEIYEDEFWQRPFLGRRGRVPHLRIPYKDIREVTFNDPPREVKKRPKSARKIGGAKRKSPRKSPKKRDLSFSREKEKFNMNDRLRRVFRDELGRDFNKTDFRVGEVLHVIKAEGKWPKWNSRVNSISGSTLEIYEDNRPYGPLRIPYKDIREVIFSDPPPEVKKRPKSARKKGGAKKKSPRKSPRKSPKKRDLSFSREKKKFNMNDMNEFVKITRKSLGNRNFNKGDFRVGDKIEIMYIDSWLYMASGATQNPSRIVVLSIDEQDLDEMPVLGFSYGLYKNKNDDWSHWPCVDCVEKLEDTNAVLYKDIKSVKVKRGPGWRRPKNARKKGGRAKRRSPRRASSPHKVKAAKKIQEYIRKRSRKRRGKKFNMSSRRKNRPRKSPKKRNKIHSFSREKKKFNMNDMNEFVKITRKSLGNRNFNEGDFKAGDKIEIMHIDGWLYGAGGETQNPGRIVVLDKAAYAGDAQTQRQHYVRDAEAWSDDEYVDEDIWGDPPPAALVFSYGLYKNKNDDWSHWPCSDCVKKMENKAAVSYKDIKSVKVKRGPGWRRPKNARKRGRVKRRSPQKKRAASPRSRAAAKKIQDYIRKRREKCKFNMNIGVGEVADEKARENFLRHVIDHPDKVLREGEFITITRKSLGNRNFNETDFRQGQILLSIIFWPEFGDFPISNTPARFGKTFIESTRPKVWDSDDEDFDNQRSTEGKMDILGVCNRRRATGDICANRISYKEIEEVTYKMSDLPPSMEKKPKSARKFNVQSSARPRLRSARSSRRQPPPRPAGPRRRLVRDGDGNVAWLTETFDRPRLLSARSSRQQPPRRPAGPRIRRKAATKGGTSTVAKDRSKKLKKFLFVVLHNKHISEEEKLKKIQEIMNKKIAQKWIDINTKDKGGFTALIVASRLDYFAIVKYLVEHGANVNAKAISSSNSRDGRAALVFANNLEIVKFLVKNGANVNAKSGRDHTALRRASQIGYLEIVKYLVKNGANVNVKDDSSNTALMEASRFNHLEIVKILVKNGANVNAKNRNGNTALLNALANGYLEIVKYLVKNGANVNAKNKQGNTALMSASYHNKLELAKFLVKNGANVNAKDNKGNTALMIAHKKGHFEIVRFLKNPSETTTRRPPQWRPRPSRRRSQRKSPSRTKQGAGKFNVQSSEPTDFVCARCGRKGTSTWHKKHSTKCKKNKVKGQCKVEDMSEDEFNKEYEKYVTGRIEKYTRPESFRLPYEWKDQKHLEKYHKSIPKGGKLKDFLTKKE